MQMERHAFQLVDIELSPRLTFVNAAVLFALPMHSGYDRFTGYVAFGKFLGSQLVDAGVKTAFGQWQS